MGNEVKKINVMLYGGFDKKTKNRAEIVMCDKCEQCSFYKKNLCLNVTSGWSHGCRFGKVNKIDGYTQRAQKRYSFDSKYKTDEYYGKLKHPSDWRVGLIDDTVVFNLTYAICDKKYWSDYKKEWEQSDEYKCRECGFSTGTYSYIPLEELTTKVLHNILVYRPQTMFGYNEITDYQQKIVPNILFELNRLLPDIYMKLIEEYPSFKDRAPNFIDKKAYIHTLADGVVLLSSNGKFIKEDGYLVSTDWKSAFLPFGSKTAEMRVKITEDMVYSIDNNSQVDENTVFM